MTEACNWLGQKTAIETLETNLIFPKNGLDNGEHLSPQVQGMEAKGRVQQRSPKVAMTQEALTSFAT
jgi:hypothetical protein